MVDMACHSSSTRPGRPHVSVVTDGECYEHVKVCSFGMLPSASLGCSDCKVGGADCMAK